MNLIDSHYLMSDNVWFALMDIELEKHVYINCLPLICFLQALVCFTFFCTGEGCLYDAILRNDLAVLTCEAEKNSGCFVSL